MARWPPQQIPPFTFLGGTVTCYKALWVDLYLLWIRLVAGFYVSFTNDSLYSIYPSFIFKISYGSIKSNTGIYTVHLFLNRSTLHLIWLLVVNQNDFPTNRVLPVRHRSNQHLILTSQMAPILLTIRNKASCWKIQHTGYDTNWTYNHMITNPIYRQANLLISQSTNKVSRNRINSNGRQKKSKNKQNQWCSFNEGVAGSQKVS